MKHYMVLCYENRSEQSPSKKVVLHETDFHSIGSLLEKYAYIVVESLDSFE
jgi:hypothetical protein